jgi:hypothetical protein
LISFIHRRSSGIGEVAPASGAIDAGTAHAVAVFNMVRL